MYVFVQCVGVVGMMMAVCRQACVVHYPPLFHPFTLNTVMVNMKLDNTVSVSVLDA